MRYFAFILAFAVLAFVVRADNQLSKVPKEAIKIPTVVTSREDLVKTFGTSVGFGPVERAEFSRSGRQVFAVWYCPFSGRAACYLHAYYYDPSKSEWVLLLIVS